MPFEDSNSTFLSHMEDNPFCRSMSLTHKHVKIFEKIHQKHKVSLDFLTLNFHKVVKLVKYAASLHCVIKRRLKITKNHRVIIRYNFLRKSLFPEKHSKPANKQLLPWSKRMILYKKKMRALEKLNNSEENPEEYDDVLDEQSTSDSALPPEEVQKKLKEQLELLKCGKRRFSVFPDGGNKRTSNSLRLSLDGASSGTATPKSDSLSNSGKNNSKSDEFIETVDALSTGDQVKSTLMVEGCEKDVASDNDKASNVSASGEQVKDGDGVNSKDETRVSGGEGSSSCTLSASREDATLNTSDTSFERSNSVLESSCEGSPQHKKGLKFLDRLINKMQNASQSSHNTSKVKQSTPCKISYPNPVNKEQLKNKGETDDPLMEKDPKENGIKVNNWENIKIVKATPLNVPAAPNNTSILTPTEDLSSASSSPDFLGFPDFELTTSTIPGMLPTPIVCKPTENNKHSAFVSEDLDKFLLENSLGNTTKVELPKRKSFEDGLVCEGAPAPKMSMPLIPHDLVKPRTVAEKRSILQKKQSIKYYMIENENTIYRELKKRSKVGCANVSLVRNIQSLAVPFTRDCWRASAWLATTNGKFYFRMLNVDGINVKLIGGHGNHKQKFLKAKRNVKAKLKHGCPRGCRQSDSFKNIKYNPIFDLDQKEDEVRIEENNTLKDLKLPLCPNEEKPVKAGPLSTKCLLNSFEPDLGPLEIYKMPPIELEVYPKLNQPLDDFVKPYLKMILPSDSITKEWAEFAVSTLVTENQKTTNNTNNSFTFTIPYLNEQNNVLVRKIYNRKEDIEKLDGDEKLSFTNFIDKNNEFSVDCANILSEMINSVAIGLSGDSLIKDDPDIDYLNNRKLNDLITKRDSTDEPKQPSNVATKKTSRLLKELNRLNAIVVDAESLYNPEEKKCGNKYCEFGCVCQSLTGQPILRKHCKKTNCMLECTCKHVVTADLDDFKSSTLTTEDALLIRKKATAKLAKVEKDFCSTVVLTDKETFLINERNTDKKRTKKAPKRFADYDYTNELPTKIKVDDDNLSFPPPPTLYPYDISPINPVFKKFKHCNVSLLKLPELNDLEPWCMIHGLYKCFCNGEATSGELYELKKDDTIDKQEEEAVVYSRKPIYSFDKAEPASEYKFYDLEHDIKMTYYRAALDTCTRAIEIPARTYKAINKRRVNSNKRKIKAKENDKTKFILLQRINGALRYDAESSDMPLSAPPPPSALPAVSAAPKQPSLLRNANNTKINVVEAPKENNELDPLHFEEEIAIVNQPVVLDSDLHDEEILPTQKTFTNEPTKHPIIASVCSLTETQPLNTSLLPSTMASSKRTSTPTISSNKGQMPFEQSTNSDSGNTLISAGISNNFNTLPSTFLAGDNSIDKNKLSKFHTVAISKLNMAVTSSMHSICNIQKKNTKNLPTPLPNTLSSHQWKLFLQAYIEGLIYVWEIKQESGVFFGATPTSTMPIVPNALSVINIKAINKKKLPLFPKMLNARFINDNTKTLSVLMTGQRTYWKIIGFINSSYDYLSQGGIFKPTPKSHPWLSAKINNLYKLLVLKQIKIEQQQKHQQILKQQEKQNRNKLNDLRKNNKIASIGLTPAPQSNLTIRKVTHDEIKNLILPIPVIGDHQWLALDLCNDFTHIYIPQWKNFLSDERVRKAISLSRKASKVVRIGHDPSSVDVYTSRESPRRIFLGPYSVGHVVDITLYQAVNSNMILREDYERTKFISFQPKTTGFWLYKRNGKLMYDIDMTFLQLPAPAKVIQDHGLNDDIEISLLPLAPKQLDNNYNDDVSLLPAATSLSNQKPVEVHLPDEIQLPVNISISKHVDTNDINDDDDDDDCFIVEDEPKNDVESKKCIENNSQEQTSELTKDKEDVQQIPTIQSDNSNKNSKSLSSTPPSPPASVCSTSSSLQPAIEAVKSAPPEIKFVAIPPNDNIQNKETPKIIITEQRTLKSATSANIDPLLIRPPNIIANKDLAKPDIDSSIQNILSQLHVGGNSPKYTSIVSGDRVYLVQSKETTASDSLPNLPKDLVILPEEQASVVGKPDKSKQLTFPNNKISSASSSAMPSERKSSTDSQTLKQAKIISVRTIQCNTEDQEPPLKKFIIQKPNPPMIEPQPPSTSQEVTKRSSLPPASKNKADAKEQNDNRHSYGGSSSSSSHPENEMTKKQNISSIRMQTQQTSQQAKFKQAVAKLKNIPVFKHTKNIPSSSSTNAPAERIEPAAPTNNNNNNNNTSHKWVPRTITAKRHSLPLSSAAVTKLSPRMPLSPAERTITNTQQHKYYQNLILKMKEAVLSRAAVSVIDTSPNSAYIVSVASGDAAKQQKGTPVTSTNTKPSEAEPKITTITTKPSTEVKRKISSSSSDIKKTSGGTPVTNLSTTKPTGTAISSASATSASSSTSKLMPEGQTSTATTSTTSTNLAPSATPRMSATIQQVTVGTFGGTQPFTKPTTSSMFTKPATSSLFTKPTKSAITSDDTLELGFVVSEVPLLGKYQVKKIGETYLLKMPHIKGTLRILGINMLNKYLSQYVRQQFNEPSLTKARWHFVSSGKHAPMKPSKRNLLQSNEKLAPQPKNPRLDQVPTSNAESKQPVEATAKGTVTQANNLNHQNGVPSAKVVASSYKKIPATISTIANTTIKRSDGSKKIVLKIPSSSSSPSSTIPLVGRPPKDPASSCARYKIVHNADDKTKQIQATEAKLKQLKDFNITPVKSSTGKPTTLIAPKPAAPPAAATLSSSPITTSSASVTTSSPAASPATVTTTTSSIAKPAIKKVAQRTPPALIPTQNFIPHHNKNSEVILIEE